MFLSVSCLVSPRKGEAPLNLEARTKIRSGLKELQGYDEFTESHIIWFGVHLQDVGDDPDAPHVCFQPQRLVVDDLRSLEGKQMIRFFNLNPISLWFCVCVTDGDNLLRFEITLLILSDSKWTQLELSSGLYRCICLSESECSVMTCSKSLSLDVVLDEQQLSWPWSFILTCMCIRLFFCFFVYPCWKAQNKIIT